MVSWLVDRDWIIIVWYTVQYYRTRRKANTVLVDMYCGIKFLTEFGKTHKSDLDFNKGNEPVIKSIIFSSSPSTPIRTRNVSTGSYR